MFELSLELDEVERPPKVWIADDSPGQVQIIRQALGPDYQIESFSDGSSLLERCATERQLPDVLLLDCVMPDLTGEEVCRFLRKNSSTSALSIMLVTASRTSVQDVVTGLQAGANDYIAKPFAPEELRARVDAVLRTQRMRDAMQRQSRRLALVALLAKRLIAAGPSLSAIVQALCSTLVESMGDGCLTWTDGQAPGGPGYFASAHRDPQAAAKLRELPHGDLGPLIALSMDGELPLRIWNFSSPEEARALLPPCLHHYIEHFEMCSLVLLPLSDRGNVRGAVALWRSCDRDCFSAADRALLQTCTDYCSLPLENAQLYEAEQRTRARLDATLDQLPVGVIVADEQGQICLRNQVSREILDVPLDPASRATPVERALAGEVVRGEEVVVQHPGGAPRTLRAAGAPVLSSTGGQLGGVVALEDITDEKVAAREREQLGLFQERFLGILGHDLRNPLNAIVMATELLARLQGNGEHRLTSRILNSSHRMRHMIDQLLDLTRARLGGGIVLSKRAGSLGAVIRNVVDELQIAHPQRGFDVQIESLPHGMWDISRLEQVLSNIISNAVAYGRPDQPIRIKLWLAQGETVCEIHNQNNDNGAIPAALQAILFEPFRRGPDENQRSQGLGLGLFIAKTIVLAHGGRIEVESSQEGGTTFRISMPLVEADAPPEGAQAVT